MIITLDEARRRWNKKRWPNFSADEMGCKCGCGEVWWSPAEFDRAQRLRFGLEREVNFNSTHRCWRYNARIGGAPVSQHKKIAFDFSLRNITPDELASLQELAIEAGFRTFGLYGTFIHMDSRLGRFWITPSGKQHSNYFRRVT